MCKSVGRSQSLLSWFGCKLREELCRDSGMFVSMAVWLLLESWLVLTNSVSKDVNSQCIHTYRADIAEGWRVQRTSVLS